MILKIISKNSLICFNKEFNLNAKNNTFSTFLKKQYNNTLHKQIYFNQFNNLVTTKRLVKIKIV